MTRGRKIEFDPNEVVDQAMSLFWEKGYLNTTYDDLVTSTNVSRYGLYKCLGEKEDAFIKCLDSYEILIMQLTEAIRKSDADIESIREYVSVLTAFNRKQPIGCMAMNSFAASESLPERVNQRVNAILSIPRKALKHAFTNAARKKQIVPKADPAEVAEYFFYNLVSASVLVRNPAHKKMVLQSVGKFLDIITL